MSEFRRKRKLSDSIDKTKLGPAELAVLTIQDANPILTFKTVDKSQEEHAALAEVYKKQHPYNHVISIHVTYI